MSKEAKEKILSYFFEHPNEKINLRSLARKIRLSHTLVSQTAKKLEKEKNLKSKKTKLQKEIWLDLENQDNINKKRIYNLNKIFESGLISYLEEEFEIPKSITLFGSYSFGEDNEKSDIDIAIQTEQEKETDLSQFEKKIKRPIQLTFLNKNTPENLKKSIYNGIILRGRIS